jgi:hypothetical protein
MNIAILISKVVPIEQPADTFIYPTTYTWAVPQAVGEAASSAGSCSRRQIQGSGRESKTSFLTMQQLSQLGFVICRHEIDALRLLRQETPRSLSSLAIVDLFNSPAQDHILLLVRGTTNGAPIVLVCTLPSLAQASNPGTRGWTEESPLAAPSSDGDCIVQLLPRHRVLRSTTDVARVLMSSAPSGDVLFDLGRVRVWFTEALEAGLLEEGPEKVAFRVDLIEFWGQ